MRIKQISVKGLFGIFDHVIPLNTEERITIIHGLNGFGKTNILRILNGIFNTQYQKIKSIPFDEFLIEFENQNKLKIFKNKELDTKFSSSEYDITTIDIQLTKSKSTYSDNSLNKKDSKNFSLIIGFDVEKTKGEISTYAMIDEKKWIDEFTNIPFEVSISDIIAKSIKKVSNTEVFDTLDKSIEPKFLKSDSLEVERIKYFTENIFKEPFWFKEIKKDISIKLIESQRLIDFNYDDFPSVVPTVSTYSDEIAKLMQDKFAEYGKISQSLDRTFPIRAVKQQHSNNLTDKELIEELNKLEKTRSRLIELGLLDRGENQDFDNQPQNIDESKKNILSVYVEDTKSKLSIFDTIANKIELLKNIINRKFAYSYKKLNFSKEQGFIFTTCYPQSLEDYSKTLSPQDLSSGEQHELVLLYELLFKVEPNSLVLIDEPELSLHVSWQSQFIEDLKEITKLADLDILMATHSPDIIQDNWDNLTVELKAPEK